MVATHVGTAARLLGILRGKLAVYHHQITDSLAPMQHCVVIGHF